MKNSSRIIALITVFFLLQSCKKENSVSITSLDSSFGMAIPYFSEIRPVDIQTRYDIGVRWVRRDFAWDAIERSRGLFDFSEQDAGVNAELAAGVDVLGILDYSNALYNTQNDNHYPPDTLDYFVRYVTETVAHFKGRIKVWEIWNEPNGPVFWKPSPNPSAFGKLLLAAANAIHRTDPDAKAMLGGMVGNSDPIFFGQRPWGFTEDLLKDYPQLIDSLDIFAIHPYTLLQYPSPEEPTTNSLNAGYEDMLKNFRRILDVAGGASKPVWITEYGWHSATQSLVFRGVPEEIQAAYMVRAAVIALSHGIQKIFVYTYSDGAGDLTQSESHFGIMRYLSDPSSNQPHNPKPGYYAYKTMTDFLRPQFFSRDLRNEMHLPANVYAYLFNSVIVAWTTSPDMQRININQTPTHVYSMYGDEVSFSGSTIELSRLPVYINR